MLIESLHLDFSNLPQIRVTTDYSKDRNFNFNSPSKFYLFEGYFLMNREHYNDEIQNGILQNIKNWAGKYVSGQTFTKEELNNSPWSWFRLQDWTDDKAYRQGFIVCCKRNNKSYFTHAFFDINESAERAAARIALAFDCTSTVAISVKTITDIYFQFSRDFWNEDKLNRQAGENWAELSVLDQGNIKFKFE